MWPTFRKPNPDIAALRDELIREQTRRMFAEHDAEILRKRIRREIRRDAGSFKAKKAETTAALQRATGRG